MFSWIIKKNKQNQTAFDWFPQEVSPDPSQPVVNWDFFVEIDGSSHYKKKRSTVIYIQFIVEFIGFCSKKPSGEPTYTIWLFNIAMENHHFQ